MCPWWLAYVILGVVTLLIMVLGRQANVAPGPKTPQVKIPRPLKPRTPEDCPVCRRPHPSPLCGYVRKEGVKPWCARKSRRGKPKRVCTAGHACPNPACAYAGNTDPACHALVGNGLRHGIQQVKCQACQKQFSSRWGTALYGLQATAWEMSRVLLAVNLGLSLAEVQLLFGHSDTTLRLWLTRASLHAEKVHAHFFQNLLLGHLQFDELYTTLRDKAHDLWVWVALDPQTKLIPAMQLGPRPQDLAHALAHVVGLSLAPGCVPVCTSDGLNLYFYALTAPFGAWRTDPATGKPKWRVALDLLYGQAKNRVGGARFSKSDAGCDGPAGRPAAGTPAPGVHRLDQHRLHRTLEFDAAAWLGRTDAAIVGHGSTNPELETHLVWWCAYYDFCRPHQALRQKHETPQARKGRQTPRCYQSRTPAMAAGLVKHIWSIEELLTFSVG
jgi:hypothetical protein